MFVADDPDAPQRVVNLYERMLSTRRDPEERRRLRAQERWACRFCGGRLIAQLGAQRVWHFRHGDRPERCEYLARGESDEHRRLKVAIYRMLVEHKRVPPDAIHFEHRLPDVGAGRIADVFAMIDGRPFAFEVQLSRIEVENYEQRTIDYDNAGIHLRWVFLGDDSWTQPMRDWLLREGFKYWTVSYGLKIESRDIGTCEYDA
jgi:competence CoiA-like predicted nuclease